MTLTLDEMIRRKRVAGVRAKGSCAREISSNLSKGEGIERGEGAEAFDENADNILDAKEVAVLAMTALGFGFGSRRRKLIICATCARSCNLVSVISLTVSILRGEMEGKDGFCGKGEIVESLLMLQSK